MMLSALVVAAVLAVGQQVDPYDFEVNVDYRPDLNVPVQPSCVPEPGGGFLCTASFTHTETARTLTGSGRRISTGQEGTFRTTCDWSFSLRSVVLSQNFTIKEFRELSGGGSQACSWAIQLASGTLSGDMRGNVSMGLAGPFTARYDATMTVNVVGGTGEFAGLVGGGTYTHSQTVPLTPPGGLRALAAAGPPSQLDLSLRKGKPAARISSPGARLTRALDGGLRVVTVPGASCRATARKGTKTVALGSARDGDRDGLVVVVRKLRPRLTPGRWTIVATCTRATARAVVTVS